MALRRPRLLNFAFTFGGSAFILVSLLVGLAAVSSEANMLYVMFGLCLGAMLVSGMFSSRAIGGLLITREFPEAACAGTPFVIRYHLYNTKRRTRCYSVRVSEHLPAAAPGVVADGFVVRIDPHETVTVETPALGRQRGTLPLGRITVSTKFPFGMFTKLVRTEAPGTIYLFPTPGRVLEPLLPAGVMQQHMSRRTRNPTGMMRDEFYGIREYRHGDHPKLIHWRRSARTGQLLVRELRDDPRSQILVVLLPPPPAASGRTSRRSAGQPASAAAVDRSTDGRALSDAEAFERAVACAATCCIHGLESGYLVGLMVLSSPPTIIPPIGGVEHRFDFLKSLSTVRPETPVEAADVARGLRWHSQWDGHAIIISARAAAATPAVTGVFARRCASIRVRSVDAPGFDRFFQPAGASDDAGRRGSGRGGRNGHRSRREAVAS